MALRDDIKKIWTEAFNDPREYVDMYFDRVYSDADVIATSVSGHPVSSLLLQRYRILFHGVEAGCSYIAGAATRRQMRGKGLMTELICKALQASRDRGDMLSALIPASDPLYFFYDRLGFATVFYVDPQRYTSLHTFAPDDGIETYVPVDDVFDSRLWAAFDRMQHSREGMVIHSQRDFLNILDDLRMDHGRFVAVADDSGEVRAMAWATADESAADGVVTVKELLGDDEEARKGALRALRSVFPGRPFKLLAEARGEGRKLYSRGMGRIVNVGLCLEIIAAANPGVKQTVRVYDPILRDNNRIYRMKDGRVTTDEDFDNSAHRPLDLDVDITTFTKLVFSSPKIGGVTGLPAERPHISLMLD